MKNVLAVKIDLITSWKNLPQMIGLDFMNITHWSIQIMAKVLKTVLSIQFYFARCTLQYDNSPAACMRVCG